MARITETSNPKSTSPDLRRLNQGRNSTDRNGSHEEQDGMRVAVARTSSPAKRARTAEASADQDDPKPEQMDVDNADKALASPQKTSSLQQSPLPSRFKPMNQERREARAVSVDMLADERDPPTHQAASTSGSESALGSNADTGTVSSPPTSMETEGDSRLKATSADHLSFDEQVQKVTALTMNMEMKVGQRGFLISAAWFNRVVSRTAQGMNENHPKSLREGQVGPVDNHDLIPSGAAGDSRGLKDGDGNTIVPLRTGLRLDEDFTIVPQEAWDLILQWYRLAEGSPAITRYVRDTSPEGSEIPNLQFELYPPIIMIQKLSSEGHGRGLDSIGDTGRLAARIVASRSELYRDFLRRAKSAAGISMANKVQVWRLIETLRASDGRAGIPTPASSRSGSPAPDASAMLPAPNMTLDLKTFECMPEGTQKELLDIRDETANEKYNGHVTVAAVGFPEAQTIVLDEQVKDTFTSSEKLTAVATNPPSKPLKSSAMQQSGKNPSDSRRSPTPGIATRSRTGKLARAKGNVGLGNLGNTCYMNSALQCIRGVEELTTYFLLERYKDELNPDNPLGHTGAIAKAYAALLSAIFEGNQTSFSPRSFKATLGRCQPLFSGYGQQDSQEFLSFLIDGLHEDLNRIHKKPYIENPDSDDKTVHDPEAVKQLGETFRRNHQMRNDSVVMDLFSGFYKNTMVCPVCDKVSVTFDPYAQVTLQLPVENTWQHQISYAPLHGSPVLIDVDIDKNSSIRTIKEYVAKRMPGTRPENLVMAEEYSDKFYKVFENGEVISEASIQASDRLWMYELDESPTNWPPTDKKKSKANRGFVFWSANSSEELPDMNSSFAERMAVPVVHRMKPGSAGKNTGFLLWPSIILVTREEAKDFDCILRKVLQKVETMTTRDMFEEQESRRGGSFTTQDISRVGSTDDESRLQTRTVDNDDGFVDVSMADTQEDYRSEMEETAASCLPRYHRGSRSKILDPSYFIDPDLRNLFEISIYSNKNEIIPTGFSALTDTSRLTLLETRIPQLSSRRPSFSSWNSRRSGRWDRESPQSSEDELSRSETNIQILGNSQQDMSSASSDGESSAPDRPPARLLGDGLSKIKKGGRALRTYSRNGRKRFQRSKSRGTSENEYLLRLGEGLVLDWTTEGLDQLFEGSNPDDLRGQRTDTEKPLIPDPELEARKARRSTRKKQGVSLDECFSETSKSEVLSEENAWYCNRCKELRRATKTLEIWTVPDILVVHLKRFSSQSRLRDKVDVFVDFPVEALDMEGKVGLPEGKSPIYDLFAVDNHYGGLGGGHYTANVRNFFDKKWYDYNGK